MEKTLYDLRGRQRNIFRLAAFDPEGFVHTLFYHLLVPLTIIYGTFIFLSYIVTSLSFTVKILTVIVWLIFTPQLFETVKGLSMMRTNGLVFNHFNKFYKEDIKSRYTLTAKSYVFVPYLVLCLWAVGLIILLLEWVI